MATARMASEQNTAYSTQCSAGQPVGCGKNGGAPLSNSLRPEAATAVIGFHSAITRSGPGRVAAEMNAEEMKVSGNSQISPALWATSTFDDSSPVSAPTQDMAKANSRMMPNASAASAIEPLIRQPTM